VFNVDLYVLNRMVRVEPIIRPLTTNQMTKMNPEIQKLERLFRSPRVRQERDNLHHIHVRVLAWLCYFISINAPFNAALLDQVYWSE